jgi:hypothetical protein
MGSKSTHKPEQLVSAEEALELCRTDVEAMHNLQYLVADLVQPSETLQTYLKEIDRHLQHLTDVLCRG